MAVIDLFNRTRTSSAFGRVHGPSLKQRLAVWKTRRALARLDARALNDIGVSRKEAMAEATKTVWDVPATWLNVR